ncbi:MAG: hypothetical protein M3Z66_17620 [Chloroflexota bacterium]|nr:hypothetical protein [Chloroflexota bacterium]
MEYRRLLEGAAAQRGHQGRLLVSREHLERNIQPPHGRRHAVLLFDSLI